MTNGIAFGKQTVARWRHILLVITAVMMIVALTACGQSEGGLHQEKGTQDGVWSAHIRKVHDALAKNDIGSAEWAWHYAHVTALRSGSWESMIEVGDAALCIGEAAGFRKGSAERARQSYSVALMRARLQGSIDGLRRIAQAFAELGDGEAVDQCLQIVKNLGTRPPVTRVDVPSVLIAENTSLPRDLLGSDLDHVNS
ncbi:MAG: hypothetical protein ACE5JQ_13995 [Candidatus Methylomirabilales bacterium]